MQNHKNRLIWRKVLLKKQIAKIPNKKKWWLSFLFNFWNEELKFCYVCDYPMYINPCKKCKNYIQLESIKNDKKDKK